MYKYEGRSSATHDTLQTNEANENQQKSFFDVLCISAFRSMGGRRQASLALNNKMIYPPFLTKTKQLGTNGIQIFMHI